VITVTVSRFDRTLSCGRSRTDSQYSLWIGDESYEESIDELIDIYEAEELTLFQAG